MQYTCYDVREGLTFAANYLAFPLSLHDNEYFELYPVIIHYVFRTVESRDASLAATEEQIIRKRGCLKEKSLWRQT